MRKEKYVPETTAADSYFVVYCVKCGEFRHAAKSKPKGCPDCGEVQSVIIDRLRWQPDGTWK